MSILIILLILLLTLGIIINAIIFFTEFDSKLNSNKTVVNDTFIYTQNQFPTGLTIDVYVGDLFISNIQWTNNYFFRIKYDVSEGNLNPSGTSLEIVNKGFLMDNLIESYSYSQLSATGTNNNGVGFYSANSSLYSTGTPSKGFFISNTNPGFQETENNGSMLMIPTGGTNTCNGYIDLIPNLDLIKVIIKQNPNSTVTANNSSYVSGFYMIEYDDSKGNAMVVIQGYD